MVKHWRHQKWSKFYVVFQEQLTIFLILISGGFDTALNTIVETLDRLRDTSSSHQRCTILEVMGRRCGDLTINAGIAAGAELVITSDTGYDEDKIIERLKQSKASDKDHAIVVITEHITDVNELAKKVEAATGFETRANVLGHFKTW